MQIAAFGCARPRIYVDGSEAVVCSTQRSCERASAYRGKAAVFLILSQVCGNAPIVEGRRVALFFGARGRRNLVATSTGVDIEFEDLRLQPTRALITRFRWGGSAAMH